MIHDSQKHDSGNYSTIPFILKRSFIGFFYGLIIFIPLFILYVLIKFFPSLVDLSNSKNLLKIIIFIIIYSFIAVIYSFAVTHLQFIERIVRIYLQNFQEDSKIIAIAKKIFKDSLKFRFNLFLKHYLIPVVLSLTFFCYGLYSIAVFSIDGMDIKIVFYKLILAAGIILLNWIYIHYYVSAKLRYVWFSYLNNYGKEDFTKKFSEEISCLNTVSSSKMFRKALFARIKNETAADIIKYGIGALFGEEGGPRDIIRGYSTKIIEDIAAYRILLVEFEVYKKAYKEYFKKDFITNSNIS